MTHTRWFCQHCQREWLPNANAAGAFPWTPDCGCPGCQSHAIQEITYTPSFPGGDIPRPGAPPIDFTPANATRDPVTAPPTVLLAQEDDDFVGVPI